MSEDRKPRVSPSAVMVLGFSFLAGISIWLTSLGLTGHREPWDSAGFFYVGAMLCAGLVCGALSPRWLWLSWLGMYAGQFLGTLLVNPRIGSLAPLGWFCFLPMYCLITLAGAALAAIIRATVSAIGRRKADSENIRQT